MPTRLLSPRPAQRNLHLTFNTLDDHLRHPSTGVDTEPFCPPRFLLKGPRCFLWHQEEIKGQHPRWDRMRTCPNPQRLLFPSAALLARNNEDAAHRAQHSGKPHLQGERCHPLRLPSVKTLSVCRTTTRIDITCATNQHSLPILPDRRGFSSFPPHVSTRGRTVWQ
jgi:hypothetical protein